MEFTTQQKLSIIKQLMEKDITLKELAFQFNCNEDNIRRIRDKYLTVKYVLKRHPKHLFRLEGQDEL